MFQPGGDRDRDRAVPGGVEICIHSGGVAELVVVAGVVAGASDG